jgi:hypothetical protein
MSGPVHFCEKSFSQRSRWLADQYRVPHQPASQHAPAQHHGQPTTRLLAFRVRHAPLDLGDLEFIALARHANDDAAAAEPAAEERAEAGDDGRGAPAGVSRQAQAISIVKRRWRRWARSRLVVGWLSSGDAMGGATGYSSSMPCMST